MTSQVDGTTKFGDAGSDISGVTGDIAPATLAVPGSFGNISNDEDYLYVKFQIPGETRTFGLNSVSEKMYFYLSDGTAHGSDGTAQVLNNHTAFETVICGAICFASNVEYESEIDTTDDVEAGKDVIIYLYGTSD